jgi:hypothetical protein
MGMVELGNGTSLASKRFLICRGNLGMQDFDGGLSL